VGAVLFVEQAPATKAKQRSPYMGEFGALRVVTDFRAKLDRGAPIEQPTPEPQHIVIPRARDLLRTVIQRREGIAPEQIAQQLEQVAHLSLNEVYAFLEQPDRLNE
jgi:hypothetical protein